MSELVKRLRAGPIVHAVTDLAPTQILMGQAADAIESLEARLRLLKAALEPFGKAADLWESVCNYTLSDEEMVEVRLANLRRARSLCQESGA